MTPEKEALISKIGKAAVMHQSAKEQADNWNREVEQRRVTLCQAWTELFNASTAIEYDAIVKLFHEEIVPKLATQKGGENESG